jgi:hypothetical protein
MPHRFTLPAFFSLTQLALLVASQVVLAGSAFGEVPIQSFHPVLQSSVT